MVNPLEASVVESMMANGVETMEALLEVAEATPVEVTLEEVSNEEGYITSISGALSSASASTSVPTTASISPSATFCNSAVLVVVSGSAFTLRKASRSSPLTPG